MKNLRYIFFLIAGMAALVSCEKDDGKDPGKPLLEPGTIASSAYFADSIKFSASVSDAGNIPLSTLKAQLFYGEEMVDEAVVRTKEYGQYEGKVFAPFHANIPDAQATLKLVLQNINFTLVEQEFTISLSRPDYQSIQLVVPDDREYTMLRTGRNQYAVTDNFPAKVKGYIVAPAFGANGNEVTFGWQNGKVVENITTTIPFSSFSAGSYAISFNTLTYEASPFVTVKINDKELQVVDDNNSAVVLELAKGDEITFDGFEDISNWWLDPSFFDTSGATPKFRAIDGNYKITANFAMEYFIVEATDANGNTARLNADGTGAIWVIGTDIGKPSWSMNEVGWNDGKALCLAPIGDKKYQMVLTAGPDTDSPVGQTVKASSINFKFFHQKGWGGEFVYSAISTASTLVFIGDNTGATGTKPERGDGNLGLYIGETMEVGASYAFTVDVSGGNTAAVLTVEKLN